MTVEYYPLRGVMLEETKGNIFMVRFFYLQF